MESDIVLGMVSHVDDYAITFYSHNLRPWKSPINSHNAPCLAQSCNILQPDLIRHQEEILV